MGDPSLRFHWFAREREKKKKIEERESHCILLRKGGRPKVVVQKVVAHGGDRRCRVANNDWSSAKMIKIWEEHGFLFFRLFFNKIKASNDDPKLKRTENKVKEIGDYLGFGSKEKGIGLTLALAGCMAPISGGHKQRKI